MDLCFIQKKSWYLSQISEGFMASSSLLIFFPLIFKISAHIPLPLTFSPQPLSLVLPVPCTCSAEHANWQASVLNLKIPSTHGTRDLPSLQGFAPGCPQGVSPPTKQVQTTANLNKGLPPTISLVLEGIYHGLYCMANSCYSLSTLVYVSPER